ncbi:MAG: hypothetical protein LBH79_06595 [Nitrososphaerota archaeon]|nr:hypothetical protein [Nitrososphaerota archaeon]
MSLPEEDVWVKLAPMQQERCELGAAVVEGKIYAMGGTVVTRPHFFHTEREVMDTNEMYDPETNSWIYKTPLPAPSNNFAVAVFEDQIYCIGGDGSSAFNWVYNPVLDTWENRTAMPFSQERAQANVVGGKIFLLGGSRNGSLNWIYDPLNDSWTQGASMPKGFRGASTVYKDKIYVVGAYVYPYYWDGADFNLTSEVTTLVQVYDPEKDAWAVAATGGPYCLEGLFVISTSGVYAPPKIYCLSYSQWSDIGGYIFSGTIYENMAFDLETKRWEPVAGLSVMRTGFALVVVDDLVYIVGGYRPDLPYFDGYSLHPIPLVLTLVERYTPLGYGRVAPEVCVLSLEEGGVYDFENVPLEFGLKHPVVWMGYSLDGQANVTIEGNVTLSGLSYGRHSVVVFAEDKYGNIGASETITFSVVNGPLSMFFMGAVVVTVVVAVVVCGGLLLFLRKRR